MSLLQQTPHEYLTRHLRPFNGFNNYRNTAVNQIMVYMIILEEQLQQNLAIKPQRNLIGFGLILSHLSILQAINHDHVFITQ